MSELDEKLFNRIKNDEYRKRGWDSYHNPYKECSDFTNEVCRRYAEEVNKELLKKQEFWSSCWNKQEQEISQLKKQLEDRELKCPKNKPEYISCGLLFEEVRERDVKIEDLLKVIEIQKQKLLHYAVNVCPEQDAEIQRMDIKIENLERDLKEQMDINTGCAQEAQFHYANYKNEIEALKSKLEEYTILTDKYINRDKYQDDEIESLKSKLEVKEKPDLTAEQYFNENYSGTATSEFLRPFIINSYNHGRQSRDAAIAERDKKIKELENWKREQIEVFGPILDWGHSRHDIIKLGESIPKKVLHILTTFEESRIASIKASLEKASKSIEKWQATSYEDFAEIINDITNESNIVIVE